MHGVPTILGSHLSSSEAAVSRMYCRDHNTALVESLDSLLESVKETPGQVLRSSHATCAELDKKYWQRIEDLRSAAQHP